VRPFGVLLDVFDLFERAKIGKSPSRLELGIIEAGVGKAGERNDVVEMPERAEVLPSHPPRKLALDVPAKILLCVSECGLPAFVLVADGGGITISSRSESERFSDPVSHRMSKPLLRAPLLARSSRNFSGFVTISGPPRALKLLLVITITLSALRIDAVTIPAQIPTFGLRAFFWIAVIGNSGLPRVAFATIGFQSIGSSVLWAEELDRSWVLCVAL
jgi:hypothetical protein